MNEEELKNLPELEYDDLPELEYEETGISQLQKAISKTPERRKAFIILNRLAQQIPFAKRILSTTSGIPLEEVNKIMTQLEPKEQTIGEQLTGGIAGIAPTLAFSSPFIKGAGALTKIPALLRPAAGFGTYEGLKAITQGDEPIQSALSGAGSALAFGAGGKLGASLIPRVLPFAERLGSILGGAGAGYLTAPEEEKISSAMLGGGFGLISPSKRMQLSRLGRFGGRGLKSLAGIKPEVYEEAEIKGFGKILTKENLNKDLPIKITDKIESGFKQREIEAHTAYNQALDNIPKGKSINIADFYNKIGKVLKDMNYITENGKSTGLHLNPALKDNAYTKLFDIYQASENMAGLKLIPKEQKSITSARMIKEMKFGRKGDIREVKVNKEQYIQIRDILQGLWSGESKDLKLKNIIDQFYLEGEKSGAKGLIEARSLERNLFKAKDELYKKNIIGQKRLENFRKMTEVDKRKLKKVEKYIQKPFIEDLENWSLAQEFKSETTPVTLNPFSAFGILPKIRRPLLRGYLRGSEKLGKGIDILQRTMAGEEIGPYGEE